MMWIGKSPTGGVQMGKAPLGKIGMRRVLAAVAAVAVVALAACGAQQDPFSDTSAGPSPEANSSEIVVGSANFSESNILGELYAQAMSAKGIQASTKPNIGSREVYMQALKEGSIAVVPEYSGNLLLYFDEGNPATTEAEIEQALPAAVGDDFKVLKSSPAADQDVYVVTKDYAAQHGIASLADLTKVASSAILGGPSELEKRPYGPPGLDQIYGVKFKSFKPYDQVAVRVSDLNDGKIQVGEFFTTDTAIPDNDYVMLSDPQAMILPQNVTPLVSNEVAGNADAVAAIESVQAALTTADLTQLVKQVDSEHKSAGEVAGAYLQSKGLV